MIHQLIDCTIPGKTKTRRLSPRLTNLPSNRSSVGARCLPQSAGPSGLLPSLCVQPPSMDAGSARKKRRYRGGPTRSARRRKAAHAAITARRSAPGASRKERGPPAFSLLSTSSLQRKKRRLSGGLTRSARRSCRHPVLPSNPPPHQRSIIPLAKSQGCLLVWGGAARSLLGRRLAFVAGLVCVARLGVGWCLVVVRLVALRRGWLLVRGSRGGGCSVVGGRPACPCSLGCCRSCPLRWFRPVSLGSAAGARARFRSLWSRRARVAGG